MSDTRLDIERDKMAEEADARKWARHDYCYGTCEEHGTNSVITSIKCPYYDPEEETWNYEECFEDKGW